MLVSLIQNLRDCWKTLALADLVFKSISFVVLAPLVAMLFRLFVAISGRDVLADLDIASFFVHPLGWLCSIVAGGAAVGLIALELSVLLLIAAAARDGRQLTCRQVFEVTFRRAYTIIQLAARMVILTLVTAAPFLAIGAGLYFALLTKYDINFYLATKPPVFWIAAFLIGAVITMMIAVLLRLITSWLLALPILLFEGASAVEAMRRSRERANGHRTRYLLWIAAWFAANSLLSFLCTGLILWAGAGVLSVGFNSSWQLSLIVGAILLFWSMVQVVTNLVGTCTFAILNAQLYFSTGRHEGFRAPEMNSSNSSFMPHLTWPRVSLLFGLAFLIATTAGMIAVNTIGTMRKPQVIAHRGGASHAPENTLAAFEAAIANNTDWIELDVQESKDDVIVIAHDRDLRRVSGAAATIWELTAEELRSIDIGSYFDSKFKDERVPTLTEALQICKGRAKVYIELKYYGHDHHLEQRVIELVEAQGMVSDVRIISLEAGGLRKVKSIRPSWAVGLLTAVYAGDLTRAEADVLAVKASIAKSSFIRAAHRRNKEVLVWTLNDRSSIRTMIERGVDGVITDDPALAREVVEDHAKLTSIERLLLKLADFLGRTR